MVLVRLLDRRVLRSQQSSFLSGVSVLVFLYILFVHNKQTLGVLSPHKYVGAAYDNIEHLQAEIDCLRLRGILQSPQDLYKQDNPAHGRKRVSKVGLNSAR